ncbi:MAG: hypothetical protein R2699_14645 [Acidimicrobiales bacterium]
MSRWSWRAAPSVASTVTDTGDGTGAHDPAASADWLVASPI